MLGFFHRTTTRRVASPRRAFLRLESLDSRDLPDGTPFGDPVIGVSELGAPPTNLPPTIVNFEKEEIANGLFLITGTVVDDGAVGGLTVTFSGGTSATGTTITTNSDGTFSLTIQLRVDGTDSGFLTATTVDLGGLVSEEVEVYLNPTLP